jgi:hypothetical protein
MTERSFYRLAFWAAVPALTTTLVTLFISSLALRGQMEEDYEDRQDLLTRRCEDLQKQVDKRVEWAKLRPAIDDELGQHELIMAEKLKNLVQTVKVNSEKVEQNTEIIKAGLVQQRTFLAETARLWVRLEDWMKRKPEDKPDGR